MWIKILSYAAPDQKYHFSTNVLKKQDTFFYRCNLSQRYKGILNYAQEQTQVPKKQDDSFGNEINELYNNRNEKNYFAYGKH